MFNMNKYVFQVMVQKRMMVQLVMGENFTSITLNKHDG